MWPDLIRAQMGESLVSDQCWPLWRRSVCPAGCLEWRCRPCSGETSFSGAPSPKPSSPASERELPQSPSPPGFHWTLKKLSDTRNKRSSGPRIRIKNTAHSPLLKWSSWYTVSGLPWSRARASRDQTRGNKSPLRGAGGGRASLYWVW